MYMWCTVGGVAWCPAWWRAPGRAYCPVPRAVWALASSLASPYRRIVYRRIAIVYRRIVIVYRRIVIVYRRIVIVA